ncbi:MAG: nucleotide exchange factor GrpE [Clostridia bacterium]|nr:nucleotide exchange factor GrpE [Clostridia bacterium]MBO4429023.1 nucleotide exchange factor GrpE [Clostridia bacterium]
MLDEKTANEKAVDDKDAVDVKDVKKEQKQKNEIKSEIKKLVSELEGVKKENDGLKSDLAAEKDKYLRMLAEYDNFRRRSQKDRENVYADAYSEALSELLPVLDNIERALNFADSANFADGMKAIVSQIDTAMEKLGIEKFGEAGDAFDPMLHNAVMHVEDENLGENVIAEVFQKGYKKGDRIIRHAMVKVAN